MHLFVQTYGAFSAKYQGRLRVTIDKTRLDEAPLLHLEQLLVSGNGSGSSSDAIRACSAQGVPIHFLSSRATHTAACTVPG